MKIPEKLFRFQTFNENNLNALKENKLWFSSVKKFNDPFEFCCDILSEALPRQLPTDRQKVDELINHVCNHAGEDHRPKLESIMQNEDVEEFQRFAHSSMREALIGELSKIGVCCFFPEINNGLCWAHYGDSHRGFAIGISTSRLDLSIIQLRKVFYSKTPPTFLPQSSNDALAWKSANWKHEREWRFIAPRADMLLGHGDGSKPWPTHEVYFGGRMTGDAKLKMRKLIGNEVSFYDCLFSSEIYGLRFAKSNFKTENRAF